MVILVGRCVVLLLGKWVLILGLSQMSSGIDNLLFHTPAKLTCCQSRREDGETCSRIRRKHGSHSICHDATLPHGWMQVL